MTNLELADKLQNAASNNYGDMCGMLWDAGAALRNLHTENTALRVTEDNLRQELQECQDQRRAAFRRIEELDAMRAQIGQGVPVAWGRWEAIGLGDEPMRLIVKECAPTDHEKRIANWFRLYTHPAPQQIGRGEPEEGDLLTIAYLHGFAKGKEAAHNIGEKK